MKMMRHFIQGVWSVWRLVAVSFLCPFPHPSAAQALRDDWGNVAGDIASVMQRLKEHPHG